MRKNENFAEVAKVGLFKDFKRRELYISKIDVVSVVVGGRRFGEF